MADYKTTVTKTPEGTRITSGNMTDEQVELMRSERERSNELPEAERPQAAFDSMDTEIAARNRFKEMREILAAGRHKEYTDEQKEAFLTEYNKIKTSYSLAEGGAVPMKEQMSMFEDGGLKDEGGSIDPISGNDVPPGSTQEEVRDDIPAQLSEGEFVFPADVVRFIGLGNLMRIRQDAKMGLKQMEAMGQMGNSDEATMPDDLPFDVNDLDMEDDGVVEYAEGGVVQAANGTFVQPGMSGIGGYQPSQFANYSQTPTTTTMQPTIPTAPYQPPMQQATPISTQGVTGLTGITGSPTSFDMGPPDEYKTYRNEAGQEIQVPFKGGKVHSTFTVPEGYTLVTEAKKEETKVASTAPSTQTREQSGGQSDEYPDGKPEEYSTTDLRGVGYDRDKVENEDLLSELTELGRAQTGLLGGSMPTAALGMELKGSVNTRNEFLTSQKVVMDNFFKNNSDIQSINLHSLPTEEKQNLANELKSAREELTASIEGKTKEEIGVMRANIAKEYGLSTTKQVGVGTVMDTKTGTVRPERYVEREKTYGQLFAEAREARQERDALASKYRFDAKGMSLSDVKKKAEEAQQRIDTARKQSESFAQSRGAGGGEGYQDAYQSAKDAGADDYGASYAAGVESYGISGLAKGGSVSKQMKRSGLASK